MASLEDGSAHLQTRAYQLEMFNHSLKANTIVVMGTGTGKTHVASLRIEAQLNRTPHKQDKIAHGGDNLDSWSAKIWKGVLKDVNIVVATPQVLLDALGHAYVRLKDISLLVFDEAHHCHKGSPSASIMQKFYHPQKVLTGSMDLPHVLGLTASPCISEKSTSLEQLEANLDAKCRSPKRSIYEYAQHFHKAKLVRRQYAHEQQETSALLKLLDSVVSTTTIDDDPEYIRLVTAAADNDILAGQKLDECRRNNQTPAIKDLKRFLGNAQHLHESLGQWASDFYISTCVAECNRCTSEINAYHIDGSTRRQRFIKERLRPLSQLILVKKPLSDAQLSRKAVELIRYLEQAYTDDLAAVVFVQRRCVAWVLCQLLQASPTLGNYDIFWRVGSSTTEPAALDKLYVTGTESVEFQQFAHGLRNLCIATSVGEEGLDFQAVNMVIRYDDPQNLVSYQQSRGRARKKESRFVCFQDINGPISKYEKWDEYEMELEKQYQREHDELLQKLEVEKRDESNEEVYEVKSTGARLDLDASVSHLTHFCAKTASGGGPIYLLEGETGVAVSAKVLLPSSVPPPLREAHSCRAWTTEKMAKRDAAFHAMKALHAAGMINDHLLPFEELNALRPLVHERQIRQVPAERQVWVTSNNGARPFAYRVELSHMQKKYLGLIMILSTPLHQKLSFPLWESPLREIEVTLVPLGQVKDSYDAIAAEDTTKLLFGAAFQAGSATSSLEDPSRISCAIAPELDDEQFEIESISLQEFLKDHSWLCELQPLLIWRKVRPRPYIWYPPHEIRRNQDGKEIVVAKQIRKLQILSKTFGTEEGTTSLPQDKELLLDDCQARGVATVYGPIVLMLPSILHLMAAAIRAQHANQSILRPIGFSSAESLVPALIAKSACGTFNYERLEFLGDACLKYLASVQMFFDHPAAPEGILTRKTHELIGNTRLEEAVNDIGLAPFITTETPVQKHWKLPKTIENLDGPGTRDVLSKTLADVVESVLGAAFLGGQQDQQGIRKCTAALQLFIPEIEWRTPGSNIEQHYQQSVKSFQPSLLQGPIMRMMGCQFENAKLLVEALTHSTDLVSQPALDRLEFLGDAILDQIIKVKLFEYRDLDAGRLTLCRHALASHAYLAYCALSIGYEEVSQSVPISQDRKLTLASETRRIVLTDLIKFREASLRRPIAASKVKYESIKDSIEEEFNAGRFPWTLLRSLNAPKVCSDIMESLLGALYLDSRGSLTRCEKILERIGLTKLLDQMATNINFEVRTPGARLRELCEKRKIALTIKPRCEQNGNSSRYLGEVYLDGNLSIIRKGSCLEEAKSSVAEAAMELLLALQEPQSAMESTTDGIDVKMSGMDHDGEEINSKDHGL